ncbi:MAG: cell division protein FtsB [Pseudomonadota bacterium]
MKLAIALLAALFLLVQYSLWFGDGSLTGVWRAKQAIKAQQQENAALRERNAALDAEVKDLKNGLAAIEERARSDLGMIGKDETFYQIADE